MLIYLDVETTGLEKEDKICSIAVLKEDEYFYDLVNESKKIPPLASSINNITNEMIKDKPPLKESRAFKELSKASDDDILVAHNIDFDLNMLINSGFTCKSKIIDTLRVSRHLIPELESYTLNFLRYELKLYKKEEQIKRILNLEINICPHNALSDVIITKLLLDELLELDSLENIIKLSNKPVLLSKFEFGKYSGRYIEEISMIDKGYLNWMLSLEDIDEDLRYTLEYYL